MINQTRELTTQVVIVLSSEITLFAPLKVEENFLAGAAAAAAAAVLLPARDED